MASSNLICDECGKQCASRAGLTSHQRRHQRANSQQQSAVSETPCTSFFHVEDNKAVIIYPTTFPVGCGLCRDFIVHGTCYARDIARHCKSKHSLEVSTVFRCGRCSALLKDIRKAKSHMAVHFGDADVEIPNYQCENCNMVFTNQFGLSRHRAACIRAADMTAVSEASFVIPPAAAHEVTTNDSLPTISHVTDAVINAYVAPAVTGSAHTSPVAAIREWWQQQRHLSDMEEDALQYPSMAPITVITSADSFMDHNFPKRIRQMPQRRQRSQPMGKVALQRLYCRSPKAALRVVLQEPVIQCGLDAEACHAGLAEQLQKREVGQLPPDWWSTCYDGFEDIDAMFSSTEVQVAVKHANTAPGPSGLRYSDVRRCDGSGELLSNLYNYVRTTLDIPRRWQNYNTRLLFKKPHQHQPGDEKVFKNFRPIALLDVEYKVLTSILARRLSTYLETNAALNVHQRAVFGRRGCAENALLARLALQEGKKIVFLDLADAFNSVSHDLILQALQHSCVPQWFTDLVQAIYSSTTTTPIQADGTPMGEAVPVLAGVRQGCPLSPILFCLAINPVLNAASRCGAVPLAYMDDIAVICESDSHAQMVLDAVTEVAGQLGLSFNARKCGSTTTEPVTINNEPLPTVTDGAQYQYLGILLGPASTDAAEKRLEEMKQLAHKVADSPLKPQQKLHCLRSLVMPRAYYAIQHGSPRIKRLRRLDEEMAAIVRKVTSLPAKAATAYIRASRQAGAPGIASLSDMQARMRVADFMHGVNDASDFGTMFRASVMDTAGHLMSVISGLDATFKYLSGHPTVRSTGGGWLAEVRAAVRRLTNDTSLQLAFAESDGKVLLAINGQVARQPWQDIRRAQEAHYLHYWATSPNQGRFAAALSSSATTKQHTYSFRLPFADWRFAHAARLNLTPLKGAATWASWDKKCRRCNAGVETMAHVLCMCGAHKQQWMQRHHSVLQTAVAALSSKWDEVLVEQRQGDCVPDLVVVDSKSRRAIIIDVKVSVDLVQTFNNNVESVAEKYEPLRRHYEARGFASSVKVLQIGTLGSVPQHTHACLRAMVGNPKKARHLAVKIAASVLHNSRNIVVHHLTGVEQLF